MKKLLFILVLFLSAASVNAGYYNDRYGSNGGTAHNYYTNSQAYRNHLENQQHANQLQQQLYQQNQLYEQRRMNDNLENINRNLQFMQYQNYSY